MVRPLCFVGMGRLTFPLFYLMAISFVIKNCTENCTAKLLTEIKVEIIIENKISGTVACKSSVGLIALHFQFLQLFVYS